MSDWLHDYHHRIQEECKISLEKRDRVTNWSYAILATVIATYVGFFADGTFVLPIGRFALVAGVLFVLIRFFFTSMIAYGFFLKWRYLRNAIEQHWMNNKPTINEIKQYITDYDHGRSKPIVDRNRLAGQIKSGFFLILIIPLIPIGIEFYLNNSNPFYYVIMVGIGIYAILEMYNFQKYDHNNPKKNKKE
jgi:hypothetical protein